MKRLDSSRLFAECRACRTGYWLPDLSDDFPTADLGWERSGASLDDARVAGWADVSMQGEMLPGVVPSPDDVAAFCVLGRVPLRRVPWWAADWLVQGRDGESLRLLAGEDGTDVFAIVELLPRVLAEVGAVVPRDTREALDRSLSYVARLCLEGRLTERATAQMVEHLIAAGGFDLDFYSLPLGQSYGLDDEWEGGWGRSDRDLSAEVRRLCELQISGTPGQEGSKALS